MTEEQKTLNEIQAYVQQQAPDVRQRVINTAEAIAQFVREAGPEGYLALSLVGAQFAAQETL